MDISLQLSVSEVIEGVDAAHQLVELEDRLSRRVMLRQGTQFANQRVLTGFLESKGSNDPVEIGVPGDDCLAVDLSGRLKKIGFLRGGICPAIQMLDLRLQVGEARRQLQSEPVRDGEIRLVDDVHVAGYGGWHDVRSVVVADVEDVVTFVLIGTDQFCFKRNVIGKQCVGDHALAASKVLARISSLDRRRG